jgi:long-chain acyl-CoA synthetase
MAFSRSPAARRTSSSPRAASIENALKQQRWISQAVVYGDRRPYLTALVTLDPAEAPALAAKLGIPADVAAMAADPRVHDEIQHAVDQANDRFARIEQVKRFLILERDLSEEEGELTPTAKVKRAVVYDRYGDRFDALYQQPDPGRPDAARPPTA